MGYKSREKLAEENEMLWRDNERLVNRLKLDLGIDEDDEDDADDDEEEDDEEEEEDDEEE